MVIQDRCQPFFMISLSVQIWSYYWVTHFAYIGLSMLILNSRDTFSGAVPLEIWACTCSAYNIWALSCKNDLHDWFTVKLSGWKWFVMLWRTGTILPWCFSVKLFTLSVYCPLNMSAMETYFLVEQRSSSYVIFCCVFELAGWDVGCFVTLTFYPVQ